MAPLGSAGVREGSLRPCQLTPRMGAPGVEGAPADRHSTTGPPGRAAAPAWFAGPWLGRPWVQMDGTVPGRRLAAVVPAPATPADPIRPRVSTAHPRANDARVLTRTSLRDGGRSFDRSAES